jgi:VWFA-related protein
MRWLAPLLVAVSPAFAEDPPPAERPSSGLVESTAARLTQVDVTVTGDPQLVGRLAAADFRLKVHDRWIDSFTVDRSCPAAAEAPGAGLGPPTDYLLYFDQTQLTLAGRVQSLAVARGLVSSLVGQENRAMIMSNARDLAVVEGFTDDAQRLLAALDRLEHDFTQWDSTATQEPSRVTRLVEILNDDENVGRAVAMARSLQRDELWRTDRSMRRLTLALGRLIGLPSRKAVIFFADTLRQNAGEHYLSFFGPSLQRSIPGLEDLATDVFAAGSAFDVALNAAAGHGIRFYTVYAAGLVDLGGEANFTVRAAERAKTEPPLSLERLHHARETLADLAAESGGAAFLRGQGAERIAERILGDLSCVYTLSFDPSGLPEDAPLRVLVSVTREGVRLGTQGRLVLPSDSTRLTARLLAAFAGDEAGQSEGEGLWVQLVPIGYFKGAYATLLQVHLRPGPLAGGEWEVGASLYDTDRVLEQVSGTLAATSPSTPMVLEGEISLRPGAHRLAVVAHETSRGHVLSEQTDVSWPDPDGRPVTCTPPALMQPVSGAFLRAGHGRVSGVLARAPAEAAATDLPIVFVGLVCRGRRHSAPLRVERTLEGDSTVHFPLLEFELGDDRCVQVRDLVPEDGLGPGSYRYTVRALSGDVVLHEVARDFVTAGPGS